MDHVNVCEPERMNLLGLLLASLLRRRLADRRLRRPMQRLRATVAVEAGGMGVTLVFDDGEVSLTRDLLHDADAVVSGSLTGLLDAALGRNRIRRVLRGELRARGSPMVLWRVMKLLRVADDTSVAQRHGATMGRPS
jgi:hypothetical protein